MSEIKIQFIKDLIHLWQKIDISKIHPDEMKKINDLGNRIMSEMEVINRAYQLELERLNEQIKSFEENE